MATLTPNEFKTEAQLLVEHMISALQAEQSEEIVLAETYCQYTYAGPARGLKAAFATIELRWNMNLPGAERSATLHVFNERDLCRNAPGAAQKALWIARMIDLELREKLGQYAGRTIKFINRETITRFYPNVQKMLAEVEGMPGTFIVHYTPSIKPVTPTPLSAPMPAPMPAQEKDDAILPSSATVEAATPSAPVPSAPALSAPAVVKVPETIVGQDHIKSIIELGIKRNTPILLEGPTGCGKTGIIEELAYKLGQVYTRVNLNGQTGIEELIGRWLIKDGRTYWQDGILLTAMKEGHWLLVDELNAALPEVLFVFQSLLDNGRSVRVVEKDGSVVQPHPNFRCLAAINPSDEYAGTKELNFSLKSRFGLYIRMDFPTPACEAKVLSGRGRIHNDVAYFMVEVALRAREGKKKGLVYGTLSTRDLLHWADLYHDLMEQPKLLDLGKAKKTLLNQILKALAVSAEFTILARHQADQNFISKAMSDIEKDLVEILDGNRKNPVSIVEEAEQIIREAVAIEVRAKDAELQAHTLLAEANEKMQALQQREAAMKDLVTKKVAEMLDLNLGQTAPPVSTEMVLPASPVLTL